MSKLKSGWQNIVLVGLFVSLAVSYIALSYLYKIVNKKDEGITEIFSHPAKIFQYVSSDENLKIIVPFLPIALLAVFVYMLRKNIFSQQYSDASSYGLYGTARWADANALRNGKVLASSKKSTYKSNIAYNLSELEIGYILGKVPNSKKLLTMHEHADVSNQNIVVIGTSGSRKTQSYVIPNLVNVRDKSIIVTDPKGELYNLTAQLKKDQGYKIYQVDFISFMQSKYNPLSYVETTLQAQKVANTIITNFEGEGGGDNVFFKNSAINMLSALIIYVKAEYPPEDANMETVVDVYTNYVQDEKTFNEWIQTIPKEHPAKEMLNSIIDLTGNTRGSVTSTLNNGFNVFKLPQVKRMTRESDFHFKDFVDDKAILYVKLSMEDDTFNPLTSVFFSQMINIYYDVASQSEDQKLKRKVVFMLDEFANIGKIDGYSRTLATCRSLGLSMHTIIQNKSQLEKKSMYGHEETNDILGNHDTTILLRAKAEDTETTKWISDALGQTTKEVQKEQVSVSRQGKTVSTNKEHVERPLLTQSEIGSLEGHQSIVIISGQNPLFLEKTMQSDIYQDLISKKVDGEFVPNYINKRKELGFDTPIMDDAVYEVVEEQNLSDYQREKAEKENTQNKVMESLNLSDNSPHAKLVTAAGLNENDIKELQQEEEQETRKIDSKVSADLEDTQKKIDEMMEQGEQIVNRNAEDAISELGI